MYKSVSLIIAMLFASSVQAKQITVVAMGDAPYFGEAGSSMFDKLIDQTNALNPDFVLHVGDIRGGDEEGCSDAAYQRVFSQFKRIQPPLIYTPGDNEWTDCHREGAGSHDPVERLASLRKVFFSDSKSLGQNPVDMEVQSNEHKFKKFAENRRWIKDKVVFVTVHVVGSKNNYDVKRPAAMEEYEQRNEANLSWLDDSLKKAQDVKAEAMVIVYHADLRLDLELKDDMSKKEKKKIEKKKRGFNDTVEKLVEVVKKFNKPVLGIHGDTHQFIIDNPLKDANSWGLDWPLENFTRLEVYGAPDVRGVVVKIDTAKKQPFSFTPMPYIAWEYN